MLDTFLISFRLKNTYRVNSIIYMFKQIPIIRRVLPMSLYKNQSLKIFGLKLIAVSAYLKDFKRNRKVRSENNNSPAIIGFSIGCLLVGYALIFSNLIIPIKMMLIVLIILSILAVILMSYVLKYDDYHQLSHKLLKNIDSLLNTDTQDIINDSYHKMITLEADTKSNKTGFEYFNELFMQRHKKILWKTAKRQTYMIAFIIVVIIGILFYDVETQKDANNAMTSILPFFVFIMYLLNTAKNITQAMFVNCDHSMLTYSFYRIPKNILILFKIRLREIVKINLLPAIVLALGYMAILFICGGIDQAFLAFISFISIISMSIFFSTHYLILYYLLQPYNVK